MNRLYRDYLSEVINDDYYEAQAAEAERKQAEAEALQERFERAQAAVAQAWDDFSEARASGDASDIHDAWEHLCIMQAELDGYLW